MIPKIIIHAMGSGETSHALALIRYVQPYKYQTWLSLQDEFTQKFFKKSKLKINWQVNKNLKSFKTFVKSVNPTHIIFCNSKSFKHYQSFIQLKKSPFPKAITITLDSNWLFNQKYQRFPFIEWADHYFVNIPKQVFIKGLKNHGGNFEISTNMQKRIKNIGFIPSYQKPDHHSINSTRKHFLDNPSQKLIFCYFSGYGALGKPWILTNLIKAVQLLKIEKRVKIICIGNTSLIQDSLLKTVQYTLTPLIDSVEKFYLILASSDLVFQHQGLATLEQAISAQIPVIANVRRYPKNDIGNLHPSELRPFSKSHLCRIEYKSTSIKKIAKNIHELLFDQKSIRTLKKHQSKIYSPGEEELFKSLKLNKYY